MMDIFLLVTSMGGENEMTTGNISGHGDDELDDAGKNDAH